MFPHIECGAMFSLKLDCSCIDACLMLASVEHYKGVAVSIMVFMSLVIGPFKTGGPLYSHGEGEGEQRNVENYFIFRC